MVKVTRQQGSRGDHHVMDSKPTSPEAADAVKPLGTPVNDPQTIVIALDASTEAEHAVNCE